MQLIADVVQIYNNYDFKKLTKENKWNESKKNWVKENPEEYFSILRNAIKRMNRCAMKPRHRLILTREILELFYPAALESLTEMADKKRNSGGVKTFPKSKIENTHWRTWQKLPKY